LFSDTPAVESGVLAAQILVGRESLVADVYGLKTEKAFVSTLEDNIANGEQWINLSVSAQKQR
jgi:hypothetical protein